MSVLRLTRLTVAPENAEEMQVRRVALIEAVRTTTDGLTEAKLARIDDETWLDVWRWESAAALDAVTAVAPTWPEAKAGFALVQDATVELYDLVDER